MIIFIIINNNIISFFFACSLNSVCTRLTINRMEIPLRRDIMDDVMWKLKYMSHIYTAITALKARPRSDCTLISHHTNSELCKLKIRSNKLHIASFNVACTWKAVAANHTHVHCTHTRTPNGCIRQVRGNCYNATHEDNSHSLCRRVRVHVCPPLCGAHFSFAFPFDFLHIIVRVKLMWCKRNAHVQLFEANTSEHHSKRRRENNKWEQERVSPLTQEVCALHNNNERKKQKKNCAGRNWLREENEKKKPTSTEQMYVNWCGRLI